MPEDVQVTFLPSEAVARVPAGTTLLQASAAAGLVTPAPCGGRGTCGACGVVVVEGVLDAPDEAELQGLRRAPEGVRLACRARISGPVAVRLLAAYPGTGATARASVSSGGAVLAAVDLGTTTVSAAIVDSASREELARAARANRQMTWGSDVLTRVSAALAGQDAELRVAAEYSVLDALEAACSVVGVGVGSIERLVLAGNTVMSSLLLGLDVRGLSAYPFEPPFRDRREIPPSSPVKGMLAEGAETVVLPPIAGFVGGDTLAAIVSAGMLDAREPALIIDLGTNAEVALACESGTWVASAAAGPAFEGAGIACGGPAVEGGVTGVRRADHGLTLETIGDTEPLWVTGSGLVSAIDVLRETGHLNAEGLLSTDGPLAHRMTTDPDGVLGLVLLEDAEPSCLRIDQRDVRAFQLAKAAVRVAVDDVLAAAGVPGRRVERVFLAGAFGSAMDPAVLVRLGVLPEGLGARARAIGDAALRGAVAVAVDPDLEGRAMERVRSACHVDLAADPRFSDWLMEALTLDASR